MKFLNHHQHQQRQTSLLLMIEQPEENIDDDDENECQKIQTSSSNRSSPTYLMAILLSCLMTFLISLFITSLSLVWILGSQSKQLIINEQRDSSPSFNFMILNNDRILTNNSGRVISINLRSFSNEFLDNDDNKHKELFTPKFRRNSILYLDSKQKLNEILSYNYPSNFLLNLTNFRFIISNVKRCQNLDETNLNLVIVVHSAAEHFYHRQVIRNTWGKIRSIRSTKGQANIVHLFVLGASDSKNIQNNVQKESDQFGDLIQGNFLDTYQNLTYKHILSLRWAVEYCPKTQFILKIDDDPYLNIYAVIESLFNYKNYLNKSGDEKPIRNLLACSLFPNNTKPKRHGKWSLSYEIYPYETFPSYCSGVGYLLTPDVAFDLFEAAHHAQIPLIPIDDVYVTGLVAKSLENLQPVPLNSLYVYDGKKLLQWLNDSKKICPQQIWIGDIGSEPYWNTIITKLWNKTEKTWNNYYKTNRCN